MGFRQIWQRIGKLWWLRSRRAISTVESFARRKQTIECGSRAEACGWERSTGAERQFEMRAEMEGRAATASACTQRILEKAARAGTSGKKQFRADDIAQEVLGTDSAAAISNVLVIGSEGFPSFKRMQIRFADPRQVPAIFTLLAAALRSGGVDFSTTRNSSIPAAEIWLACPLNDWHKTLLSCAAPIGEQTVPDVLARPVSRETRLESRAPVSRRHGP